MNAVAKPRMLYLLELAIRAIDPDKTGPDGSRRPAICEIPAGSHVELCCPAEDGKMVRILWRGNSFLAFQRDVEERGRPDDGGEDGREGLS